MVKEKLCRFLQEIDILLEKSKAPHSSQINSSNQMLNNFITQRTKEKISIGSFQHAYITRQVYIKLREYT